MSVGLKAALITAGISAAIVIAIGFIDPKGFPVKEVSSKKQTVVVSGTTTHELWWQIQCHEEVKYLITENAITIMRTPEDKPAICKNSK